MVNRPPKYNACRAPVRVMPATVGYRSCLTVVCSIYIYRSSIQRCPSRVVACFSYISCFFFGDALSLLGLQESLLDFKDIEKTTSLVHRISIEGRRRCSTHHGSRYRSQPYGRSSILLLLSPRTAALFIFVFEGALA